MDTDRRLLTGVVLTLAATPAFAAAATDSQTVAKRLEAFRAAQAAQDAKTLTSLCATDLSYSHSDAHIEDKATFVKNATDPKSKVLSLEYQNPAIKVVGDVAIVRFHWVGKSQAAADGKISDTSLHVLQIWQKQRGQWNLLARCSTKL